MNKPILDVACGGRMFYFNKKDPRVLFCDNRDMETVLCDRRHFEIHPDVRCDFTALPFEDNSFKLIVFDPPHLIKSKRIELPTVPKFTGWQNIKYGALYQNWREMLTKGFAECFRVLEPNGVLIFKWNETDIPVSEVLKFTPEQPIFGHKSGKRSNTHWLCFMKENKT